MSPSPVAPFHVISDFIDDARWGRITSELKRYEIVTPLVQGSSGGRSEEGIGAIHGERSSLIVRIGGGHLRAPPAELLDRMRVVARDRLGALGDGPVDHVASVVAWLEAEQREGLLERSYTTATLLVAVDDAEIWSWHSGPHGLVRASAGNVRFASTDLRIPVLRALGAMPPRGYASAEIDRIDQSSSVFCMDTPDGYERIRARLAPAEFVIALDRGALPFGPWPREEVSLDDFWRLDAAWKHGEIGRAVAVGTASPDELRLPAGWRIQGVPFQ